MVAGPAPLSPFAPEGRRLALVDDVIFSLDTHPPSPPRLVAVPWVDASEIFDRARENSLAARKLHKNLERIHRGDGADREIIVDEDTRQALLLILVGIEADGLLLSALVELREAAGTPIVGG